MKNYCNCSMLKDFFGVFIKRKNQLVKINIDKPVIRACRIKGVIDFKRACVDVLDIIN